MAAPPSVSYQYDVYLAHSHADDGVARRLGEALVGFQFSTFVPQSAPDDEWAGAAVDEALDASRILVLLWTRGAAKSRQISREIQRFVTLEVGLERPIVRVVLGENGSAEPAPRGVASRETVVDAALTDVLEEKGAWGALVERIAIE